MAKGRPVFNEDRCKGCQLCTTVCPVDIVHMSERINSRGYYTAEVTDPDKCITCMKCARICPDVVIEILREATKEEK